VTGLNVQATQKGYMYMDKKSTKLGEVKTRRLGKWKARKKGMVLILCLTYTFNLFDLGGPTRGIKTPYNVAIRVNEVTVYRGVDSW